MFLMGKSLVNYGKIHHAFNGKIHHFLMENHWLSMENHHAFNGKIHHFLMENHWLTMERSTMLLMGKSTISTGAIFKFANCYVSHYQRVVVEHVEPGFASVFFGSKDPLG